MKIKYQAPKGRRLKNQFMCLEMDINNWLYMMYFPESNEWRDQSSGYKPNETCSTSFCFCRSLKAAKRKIKNWNMPKGTKFRLCSRWVGYDVYITV